MRSLRWLIACALTAAAAAAPLAAQGATGTIRGRVTDAATQQPIPGATVTFGTRGGISQTDGRYTIYGAPAGTDSLRVRVIGYAPISQSVTVAGGDTVNVDVAMTAKAVNLASVVVIGYGQQRAGDVTTSVTQVAAKDFNPGVIVTPQSLIENKVAGVEVIDNNQPGGGISIRVRGQASYTAGSEPLYVVDGVPLGTGSGGGISTGNDPLNYLNPNDIESITILKDAASASIYGTNASNGVVLITTKSGQGKSRVEYGGSFSASSVTRLPSMLSPTQFRAAVAKYDSTALPQLGNANTNWLDLIGQTGMGQQHNVSFSGSGAANDYRFSLGYTNQDGVVRGTTTQQIQLRLNYGQRFYDNKLSIRGNIAGSRSMDQFTPNGVLFNAAQMGPTQPIFDTSSATLLAPWGAQLPPTGYYNWPGNSLTSRDNPLEILNGSIDHATTYRSVGSLTGKYDFSELTGLSGLTGTVDVGYDVTYGDRVTFFPNNIHFVTKNGTWGSYGESQPQQANTVLDMYLNFQPPAHLGPGTVDFTGGYSYGQSHGRFANFGESQIETNVLTDAGIPQSNAQPVSTVDVEDAKLISFFGRAGYNIDDRYLFSASLRRDGSSRFGPGNQWGNFPSVSAGWRISQEPFMQGISAISDLKLRASWGKTGNQAFGNYLFVPTYQACNATAEYNLGGQFVCPFRPSAVDQNIHWEATSAWDIGADYAIFGQRFSGTLDWYRKNTTDLLFDVPIDPASNLSNHVVTNIGSMRNTGFEFDLGGRIKDAATPGGLSWTANLNVSHNSNQVVSINPNATGTGTQVLTGGIAGGVGSTVEVLEPGQPIYSFLVCRQFYSAGKPVQGVYYNATGTDTVTGCTRGSNTIAEHDPAPHWIFGLTSNLSWNRFDLSFTLRSWLGNYVYNNVASNVGDYRELSDGSSPSNLSTSVLKSGFTQQQLLSDFYVENASFLRMDNITVGYTFPWEAQRVRLYAVVQNAFTITGYSGVDPTAGVNGIDNNIYPRSRTFTSGLSVVF
ncbi:MAG TPA: SusC/RagA family TonB-linked outer membrane protein [Gemmatimonadales bacterium]|nr:SusC/RagA family TonB-linked outer membrane protein [Gemmatimonadales bacterium]